MAVRTSTPRSAAWLWAAFSLVGWVVAAPLALFLVFAVRTFGLLEGDPFGLRIDLALALLLHGTFAVSLVRPAAWLALGTWPHSGARQALPAAVGIGLAALVEVALHEWAEARYGYYDAQLIGWTALLSIALVAAAAATFAAVVAPRGAVLPPLVALALASAGVLLIAMSNLPGLEDGIGAGGWVLAVMVGASATYVSACLFIAVRRVMRADA